MVRDWEITGLHDTCLAGLVWAGSGCRYFHGISLGGIGTWKSARGLGFGRERDFHFFLYHGATGSSRLQWNPAGKIPRTAWFLEGVAVYSYTEMDFKNVNFGGLMGGVDRWFRSLCSFLSGWGSWPFNALLMLVVRLFCCWLPGTMDLVRGIWRGIHGPGVALMAWRGLACLLFFLAVCCALSIEHCCHVNRFVLSCVYLGWGLAKGLVCRPVWLSVLFHPEHRTTWSIYGIFYLSSWGILVYIYTYME